MRITALEIKKQEFKKSLRGYDVNEVEAFLDTVANEVENLNKQIEELKETNSKIVETNKELQGEVNVYKDNEKTFQKAIVKSQDMSEEVLENAKKRAELIVKEAEIMSSKTKVQTQEDFVNLKQELEELRQKNEMIIEDIKNFLMDKLNSIEEYSRNRKVIRFDNNNLTKVEEIEHTNVTSMQNERTDDPTPDFGMDLNIDESK